MTARFPHMDPSQTAGVPTHWSRKDICIVLPTYNEAENIELMVSSLLGVVPPVRVHVVDDASPDGTGAIADRLAHDHPGRVTVLHRRSKTGLGDAYIAGFRDALASGADLIFEMDADFSHPIDAIGPMILLSTDYDVVVGSRYVTGGSLDRKWSLSRRVLSWGGNQYARLITGLNVNDTTAGFKCFRRDALQKVPLEQVRSQGYNFQIEMAMRCQKAGLKVVEYPIHFSERTRGTSKMTPSIAVEALWRILQLRFLVG